MQRRDDSVTPGLDLFWEDADLDEAAEHPLERELAHRMDVLRRYERLIENAQSAAQDDALRNLTSQYTRELDLVRSLSDALRRVREESAGRDDTG